MDNKLLKKLRKRKEEGSFRSLSDYSGLVDFISNDYLNLSNYQSSSVSYEGATGSRLISGNRIQIEEIEQELAIFFGYPKSLVFNSGYDANLSIFGSIPQKGDVVLYDEHIHASARDGIRLSLADSNSFLHNSTEDLERLLIRHKGKSIYIAIEGIYSMHGDVAPLQSIVDLAADYDARVIIDEAHSAGVIGTKGKGLTDEVGVKVYLKLVTFGKAYGSHGACVLSDANTIEYLINFGRSFIYSTALPLHAYVRIKEMIHLDTDERREKLIGVIEQFRSALPSAILASDSVSPIQIIRLKTVNLLTILSEALTQSGIAAKLILPPTVKPGEECIRICLHSNNSSEEVAQLCRIIEEYFTMHT